MFVTYLLCCPGQGSLSLCFAGGNKSGIKVLHFYNLTRHQDIFRIIVPIQSAQIKELLRVGGNSLKGKLKGCITSMPQTSRVESAWAKTKPLLTKNFSTSPAALVTSMMPGLSSEMVGTWPGSTPNMPSAPGTITCKGPTYYQLDDASCFPKQHITSTAASWQQLDPAVPACRCNHLVDLGLAVDGLVGREEVECELGRDALRGLGRLICKAHREH
jgi:hypothetical protein